MASILFIRQILKRMVISLDSNSNRHVSSGENGNHGVPASAREMSQLSSIAILTSITPAQINNMLTKREQCCLFRTMKNYLDVFATRLAACLSCFPGLKFVSLVLCLLLQFEFCLLSPGSTLFSLLFLCLTCHHSIDMSRSHFISAYLLQQSAI